MDSFADVQYYIYTVELGNKELFGRPKIVPLCQKFLIWSQEMVP